jgi:uncharacterized SAM-binding protein YcdF (DUF218 family)
VTPTRVSTKWRGAAAAVIASAIAAFLFLYGGDTLIVSADVGEPQAIVVLASHEWERLPVAAELARQYPAARVLLTLPAHVTEHNCYGCAERTNWLTHAGVASTRLTVLPQPVKNTYDEAKATRTFVEEHRVERLLVVTSPYHGRRALATFRHLFKAAGLSTRVGLASPVSRAMPSRWWLRRYDRDYVAYEWAGIVYYAIRFGVLPTT